MTKILIAEDDEHTREALREVLTMEGYQVVAAPDGPQAVDFFRVENPDFVCLALMIPGLNGYEVRKQHRKYHVKDPSPPLNPKGEGKKTPQRARNPEKGRGCVPKFHFPVVCSTSSLRNIPFLQPKWEYFPMALRTC